MNDLSGYFDLIGYRHTGAADLTALRELHRRHTHTIPFENLSPLTGEPVKLDLDTLLRKFASRRGGYCFEHNLVFKQALDTLGFRTTALMARVRLNVPPEVITPRTHMLLMVELEGERWIADTGFGRMTLTAPIRLQSGIEQDTPHGRYRLVEDDGGYRLEAVTAGQWEALYVFDLTPCYLPDYVVSNWYVSTHPASHFTRDLIAVRATEAGRHVIHNTRYSWYPVDGAPAVRPLASADEVLALLNEPFGIAAGQVAGLRERLERIVDQNL
jgi:N-hydroxyarylamine O-acetyltransferase